MVGPNIAKNTIILRIFYEELMVLPWWGQLGSGAVRAFTRQSRHV